MCPVAHQLERASAARDANGRAVPHACLATAPCCTVQSSVAELCGPAVRTLASRSRVLRSSTNVVRPNHRETAQNARRRRNLLIQEYLHVSSISRDKPPCRVPPAPAQALGAPLPERANRDGTRDRESGKRIEAITIFKKRQGSMPTHPSPLHSSSSLQVGFEMIQDLLLPRPGLTPHPSPLTDHSCTLP